MRLFTSLADPQLAATLNSGGIVVLPSDTVYGIMARASDRAAVERLYRVRGRAPEKPCIMLVADTWQITDHALWTSEHTRLTERYWPGPLSLVAPVSKATPHYLHRGTHTLAYRMPDFPELRKLLSITGPLVAPSANIEGQPTATTISEAYGYFGDTIDGYVDDGILQDRSPSTVAGVVGGKVHIFRQGALRVRF